MITDPRAYFEEVFHALCLEAVAHWPLPLKTMRAIKTSRGDVGAVHALCLRGDGTLAFTTQDNAGDQHLSGDVGALHALCP